MTEELLTNFIKRPDLKKIYSLINDNWKVLDLGCGDGRLLEGLAKDKSVKGTGVEVSQEKIIQCIKNGVSVIQGDLNKSLMFKNCHFDAVILSQTLQAVDRPDLLLDEMLRVGERALISFINFSYIGNRLQLFLKGKMPKSSALPYEWYDSPNIHFGTIKDFRELCEQKNIRIISETPLGRKGHFLAQIMPNLFARICVFEIAKK
ncbi:methionine biosynthesis protein MetW [Lentisphaerota bacterium WC36G]|nr:methionine biosynthesis protein MetW [Lentisphaerae bacterium WC36]